MVRLPSAVVIVAACTASAACGGQSAPTGPTPGSNPNPQPSAFTIAGTLTSTNGGTPLAASLDFGLAATTSDGSGRYTVTVPVTAPTLALRISGAGLIERRTYVAPGTRTVNVDAIAETGFDLTLYRQLVRNTFDTPGTMQPLRRWTRSPQMYLKTVDEAGAPIDAKTLDSTEQVLREAVPVWTSGLFSVVVTRGTESREGQSGWITVKWLATKPVDNACGRADVAKDGGMIELDYKSGGSCRCAGGPEIRPRTVRHEVGHAMGFWHTDSPADLMSGVAVIGCDGQPSTRELYHAAIAYKRSVGNVDPDVDAVGTVNLAPMRVR